MDVDSLTITDVEDEDEGTYTCIMNTTLDHDSASAELTVVGMFSFANKLTNDSSVKLSPFQVFPEK